MEMKVHVIGAGIVGLTFAKELAANGIRTTVYERKRDVEAGAEKASGILSIKGLEKSGIRYKNAIENTLNGAIIHVKNEELLVEAKEPQAYIIDRRKLIRDAYEDAEEAGALVLLGRNIDGNFLKELGNSDIIVGADGATSIVASTFGFPRMKEYILTYKALYRNANIEDANKVEIFFSDATPGFFGWTAPHSDKLLELGVGVSSKAKKTSLQAFNAFTKNEKIKERIKWATMENRFASIIPLEVRKKSAKGNVALVGDAAGQVKASTGGGIIFGIACAKVLAETIIINRNSSGTGFLEEYEKKWRKLYGMDLMLHSIVHRYYSFIGIRNMKIMLKIAKFMGIEGFLSKHGDMDSPSLILKRIIKR
ncbi:MAG: NAD(P)/FAD-dependent oxidoreductase [Candidatus Micrarchaeia archaeon]